MCGEIRVVTEVLWQVAENVTVFHTHIVDVCPVIKNFSTCRVQHCADHTHQCCFAGTICTKQTIDTVRYGIAEIVYGNMALKLF